MPLNSRGWVKTHVTGERRREGQGTGDKGKGRGQDTGLSGGSVVSSKQSLPRVWRGKDSGDLERAMGGREQRTLGPERRGVCEGRRNERSL